jgi:type IV secretion system protein VirB3
MNNLKRYSSLPALERNAIIFGVPIVFFAIFILCVMVFTVLAMLLLGRKGMFVALLFMPLFLFFRKLCMNDDNGIRIFFLEAIVMALKTRHKHFGQAKTFNLF